MMPQSSQNLYFHLGMNADDDGFCEHFTIMRMTESKPDDLKVLQSKGFVKLFDDKVLVITQWKENNFIRKDRYTPSKYLEIYKNELKALSSGQPNDNQRLPQVRLGKSKVRLNTSEKTLKKEEDKPITSQIVNYFFELKGWADKESSFYKKNKIIYSRFTKPAKELLELCDNDVSEAKDCLKKLADWAISRDLDWSIETVFKKWYDIDKLKPKEKKPYYKGERIFKMNNRLYVLSVDGEKREFAGNENEIIYK